MAVLIGETAALGSALIWAVAARIYGQMGQRISPLLLNFSKGAIALVIGAIVIIVAGLPLPQVPPVALVWLGLSGVVGIGLGDSCYLAALTTIGPRRTLLLESLAPPLAALLAWISFGEVISVMAWLGIFLTVAGVTWVIVERTIDTAVAGKHPYQGIVWGLLAALGQASGSVMSRFAFTLADLDPFWTMLIRVFAGITTVLILLGRLPSSERQFPPFAWRWVLLLVGTAFASTFLAIIGQQTALKYAPAGIAQALLATSPLFILPIAAWSGEKLSFRAIAGVGVAMAGVTLLLLNR
ncbi:MAG: DMT family transporter [Synechocystis sp.]|nr:DMT family transporter [Synechocystis sp.]